LFHATADFLILAEDYSANNEVHAVFCVFEYYTFRFFLSFFYSSASSSFHSTFIHEGIKGLQTVDTISICRASYPREKAAEMQFNISSVNLDFFETSQMLYLLPLGIVTHKEVPYSVTLLGGNSKKGRFFIENFGL